MKMKYGGLQRDYEIENGWIRFRQALPDETAKYYTKVNEDGVHFVYMM